MKEKIIILFLICSSVILSGCFTMGVKPVKVEPIKIEITVKVEVEKDLEDFFADIDTAETDEENS